MTAHTKVASAPSTPAVRFEQHELDLGSAEGQTVLTGAFLASDVDDVAVVRIDENDERLLRIYTFANGVWGPALDSRLRPSAVFVDVAEVAGRERLISYEPGRLSWFDPESSTHQVLIEIEPDFNPPPADEIPHVDITRDLNGDGRDDLVLPDGKRSLVLLQRVDGRFAAPINVNLTSYMSIVFGAEGYRYVLRSHRRLHEMDYNGDGRRDVIVWKADHFEVHLQNEDGLFDEVPVRLETPVAFDTDVLASLAAPSGVRNRRSDSNPTGGMTGRVLHSIEDLNGDGVSDLAVFSLLGGGLWSMHSTYEVHFGTRPPDGTTVFSPEVGTSIQVDGIPFAVRRHDFDQDGRSDMLFAKIKPGVFKAIGMLASAIFTRSVSLDVEFYRMEGDSYPDKANVKRKIKTHSLGGSGERAALFPPLLIGDVNGDGESDLVVGWRKKELRVHLGVNGAELFARRPIKVAVAVPSEEYTWLSDVDLDGRQDVVMHHTGTAEPDRVTLLIAR